MAGPKVPVSGFRTLASPLIQESFLLSSRFLIEKSARRMRNPEMAAAGGLRLVKRRVGRLDKLFGLNAVVWCKGDADAYADLQRSLADHELTSHRPDKSRCQHFGILARPNACLHDNEFVTTDASCRVGWSCFAA